jgi:hypothetical protein
VRHEFIRRRLATLLALLVATTGLAVAISMPAVAAPGGSGDDGEGGSKTLTQQLESASRGYSEAKEALERSKTRQRQLTALLKQLDAQLGPQQAVLDGIVQQTYRTGRLGAVGALLTAADSGTMMDRVLALETVAVNQDRAVRDLTATRDTQAQAKLAIEREIAGQQKQVTVMAKRKKQAEDALRAANAGRSASSPGGTNSTRAAAAPRNSDGSLPSEGCTVDDPTSGGCITPRMAHAMSEAQKAGFTHYVHCFREQNSGEHPKGRACDFAADKGGFGGVATGSSKTYGNNLASYFISNSSRLGVLYVIWFRRIWLPSSGWKSYSGGGGDPSSDHTNHVHLSVR